MCVCINSSVILSSQVKLNFLRAIQNAAYTQEVSKFADKNIGKLDKLRKPLIRTENPNTKTRVIIHYNFSIFNIVYFRLIKRRGNRNSHRISSI